MLENPTNSSAAANVAPVKRYAPPNQRNRALGRRKSGGGKFDLGYSFVGRMTVDRSDRLERANSYLNDGEKTQIGVPRNVPIVNHGDAGSSKRVSENFFVRLIPLHGCVNSEALQLLNNRWAAAMNALNSLPEDSSEKPVLYSRSGSPCGHAILPHLLMPAVASTGLKKDFLTELRQAMRNANASSDV